MKIHELLAFFANWAPISYQENYDNSQLICGDASASINKVLVCLDCTEDIVDEAIQSGANLIVAHHPIIFKGLKKLTGSNYVERTLIKAIKNDIAIYALHTNLDNVDSGVNKEICNRIGLSNTRILAPKSQLLSKISVYVPINHVEIVSNAMFDAGAGKIGKYDMASFKSTGMGSFRPLDGAQPHIGSANNYEEVSECKLDMLVEKHLLNAVISSMIHAHPYEEVAYDVFDLQNTHPYVGSGMIGTLDSTLTLEEFLDTLKSKFGLKSIKYTGDLNRKVQSVAVCGGSGIFLLQDAIRQKADVFVSSDVKYHEFFDAENKLSIIDMGHYESEQFTIDLIVRKIQALFDGLPVQATKISTNPVNYFI